jgi:hypothetical protein
MRRRQQEDREQAIRMNALQEAAAQEQWTEEFR